MKDLESYDDRNFYIKSDHGAEYVLKVHNGVDSGKVPFVESQIHALFRLSFHGIQCNQPVRTLLGQDLTYTNLVLKNGETCRHIVRLLRYVPGKLMCDVPHSAQLLTSLGCFVGKIDTILEGLTHPGPKRVHLWDLAQLPSLTAFVPFIQSEERRAIVLEVVFTRAFYFPFF